MRWPLIFLLLLPIASLGQIRFSNFYDFNSGADALLDIVALDDGNLALVGTSLNLTDNVGAYEGIHLKTSVYGDVEQEHRYGLSQHNFNTRAIIKSSYSESLYSGGYYCDFTVESLGYCDFYFSKLDENLDTVFTSIISRPDTGDTFLNMIETGPNTILLLGWTYNDTTDTDADLLLVTVDTLGNELNRVVWGGVGTDYVHSGVLKDNSSVLLTGYTKSFGGSSNGRTWIVCCDSIGGVLWHQEFSGSANNGTGIGIAELSDGNFVVCGGNNGVGGNDSDGILLKVDSDGNQIWLKEYPLNGHQGLWGVVGLNDGSIIACGVTDDGNDQAGWLIKTDENGDTLWTRTFDESDGTDYLRNMIALDNGDVVMVGFGRGENSTTQDGWILRVDSMGCLIENCFSVDVEDIQQEHSEQLVNLYPNPNAGVFTVVLNTQTSTQTEMKVYSISGQLVLTAQLTNGINTVELEASAGLYLYSVTVNGEPVATGKISVE